MELRSLALAVLLLAAACDVPLPDATYACDDSAGCPSEMQCWASDHRCHTGGGTDGGTSGAKRIFVTSVAVSGSFNGVAGGDSICQAAANAAGLGGTYVAWLSGGSCDTKPDGGFTCSNLSNAVDRVPADGGPWANVGGGPIVFANYDALKYTPTAPIEVDERGRRFDAGVQYWTGTDFGGKRAANNCNDWRVLSGPATSGRSGTTGPQWTTDLTSLFCPKDQGRLLCLEK